MTVTIAALSTRRFFQPRPIERYPVSNVPPETVTWSLCILDLSHAPLAKHCCDVSRGSNSVPPDMTLTLSVTVRFLPLIVT